MSRRRFVKMAVALALAGTAMTGLGTAALWLEHRTPLTLPVPTGPFAVGRLIADWMDRSTTDTLAPTAGAKRELLVWIWYPAAPDDAAAAGEYLPAGSRRAVERTRGLLISGLLTRDLANVRAHAAAGAAVSTREPSYPVVLLRGGASLAVWNYTTLAEDLASHGYVVVGIDAPYRTNAVAFPDGRVARRLPQNNPERCLDRAGTDRAACVDRLLRAWTGDMSFALDRLEDLNAADPTGRFTGRLDLTRVGVLGHSFGGAQAAQFCHDDPRCTAGIDLDGAPVGSVVREGLDRPFMFLLGEHASEPDAAQVEADIRSIYDRLPATERLLVLIRGANHFAFSDDGALLKSGSMRAALRLFGQLHLDGRRQLAVTAYCVRGFFGAFLERSGATPPDLRSPRYPEIEIERHLRAGGLK